jgi:hypothetical protein
VAGSYTSRGNTTTWVPLLDLDGSTIALVNATQTQPPTATTFTYDPSGVSTVNRSLKFVSVPVSRSRA